MTDSFNWRIKFCLLFHRNYRLAMYLRVLLFGNLRLDLAGYRGFILFALKLETVCEF